MHIFIRLRAALHAATAKAIAVRVRRRVQTDIIRVGSPSYGHNNGEHDDCNDNARQTHDEHKHSSRRAIQHREANPPLPSLLHASVVDAHEFTFHSCRRRNLRVTSTPPDELFPPNASTTVSSAPIPREMPCLRSSMASFANLKRECTEPVPQTYQHCVTTHEVEGMTHPAGTLATRLPP